MKIFIDANLSPRIAKALNALSEGDYPQVVHLWERFGRSAPDTEWLSALSREGDRVVVSGDLRIKQNPHERAA